MKNLICVLLLASFGWAQSPSQCLSSYCNLSVEYPVFSDEIDDHISILVTIDPGANCKVYDQSCYSVCRPNIYDDTYGCSFTYQISYLSTAILPPNEDYGYSETILTPESVGLHFCAGCSWDYSRVDEERDTLDEGTSYPNFIHSETHTLCCGTTLKIGLNIVYIDGDSERQELFTHNQTLGVFNIECSDCEYDDSGEE